ncbi:MAG TPA: transglycosylase SLT domain-containing protein, partial [Steroidobacteraceae bacterium]|nr:transglycosylase SLT domain-containing protein [Steroidobacteraceae bacterium]
MESIRGSRLGLFVCAALVVTACAHTPADRPLTGTSEVPVGVGSQGHGSPPVEPSSTYPEPIEPPAVQGLGTESLQTTEPTPVVGLTPAQYGDLFDRMRAGFKLDDVDSHAVDQQLDWYADHPDYLERSFGRAELYMYHIVTELEARGMPLEIALLPVVESAFEPYAYSRARASGLWQFIPGTGSRFGLKQNWWYDGRRDVVESTRAAFDYLQFLHDEFNGDWLLAIAAYNCGEAGVARAVAANEKAHKPTDFWSLKLPKETRAYVPKLLAMKRLVADPEAHGLGFSRIPNQAYFVRVETLSQIDLKVAADIAGITHEQLYELNPAFHRWATDPSGPHYLLLPSDVAELFKQNVGQLTPEQRLSATIYTVKPGDSVASVARKFETKIDVIRELNELPSGPLTVGTDLRVPSAVTLPPKVILAAARVDGKRDRAIRGRQHVHVVSRGDSLWGIARRTGMDVNTLAMMNNMQPGDKLRAGQKLRLTSNSGGSS